MGSDTFVELQVGEASLVARVTPDTALTIGQNVRVEVSPGRVHLFDRESGDRLTDAGSL